MARLGPSEQRDRSGGLDPGTHECLGLGGAPAHRTRSGAGDWRPPTLAPYAGRSSRLRPERRRGLCRFAPRLVHSPTGSSSKCGPVHSEVEAKKAELRKTWLPCARSWRSL
ncbi:hypothetical protein NDU88_004749 [Pleurodeles waltl]|uniref:Uncharacterized protein n=1 Tax=Pleurodeles waltl TaxID=8319 RepID=A0AAV7MZB0_PLEWA|nr:hypothetical protein NDU88_004749 [Pleurodeles waltl]